jgi:succinate dehydrogenase / fumarate reductase membrane anchor subunit
MVTNVTNLSRSGLFDWVFQRVSAVILLVWFVVVLGYLLVNGDSLTHEQWLGFMTSSGMRIFSLLALIMLGAHAWVGLWTISTDYFTDRALGRAGLMIRFSFQAVCGVVMFAYFIWGLGIFWGGQ